MNQDLRSRIPIGITYVLVIAGATIYGTPTTIVLLGLFFLLCLYEYVNSMSGSDGSQSYTIGLALVLVSGAFLPQLRPYLLIIAIGSSLFSLINIGQLLSARKVLITERPVWLLTLLYIALPFFLSMAMVMEYEELSVILLGVFIIVWINDAGAYFAGKAFGKRKMMPSISPNKSWEGLIGGGLAGMAISQALTPVLGTLDSTTWLILSVIIWVSGAYGDLVQSAWKRALGLKDSGKLLGGHGGFLDRLDSFIYAMPFVVTYFLLFSV